MVRAYGCIDIIIRRDVLENKKRGLSEKLIEDYKVKPEFYDDYIVCIPGGMSPYDVEMEVISLENEYGLVFNPYPEKEPLTEMVIIEGLFGIKTKNNWLKEKRSNKCGIQYYFDEE